MGSAPPSGSRPAMPGPERLVRRSILHAMRRGYTRSDAACGVLMVVELCRLWLVQENADLTWWLDALAEEARKQAPVPQSPQPDHQEVHHGGETAAGPAAR